MAGRGGYDRGLSSDMSLVLRRGDRRKPLAVRPDGLAHMDDISHALDATPDAIMHVVLHSIKKITKTEFFWPFRIVYFCFESNASVKQTKHFDKGKS